MLFAGLAVFGVNVEGQDVTISDCNLTTISGISSYFSGTNQVPSGQTTNGYWSDTGGLTFDDVNVFDTDINGFSSSTTTYNLVWHSNNNGNDYTIQLTNGITPTSVTVTQKNGPDFCSGSGIKPEFEISVEGGAGDIWNVVFLVNDGTAPQNYSVQVTDNGNDGMETVPVSFSNIIVDTDFEVTAVYPQGAFSCDYGALPTVFSYTALPATSTYNVSSSGGNLVCYNPATSSPESITLSGQQENVIYKLYYDDGSGGPLTTIDTHTGDASGTGFSFGTTVSASGTYTVKASYSGCTEETMTGAVTIAQSPDLTLAVSLTGSGCSGTLHTITVVNAENGVDYTLYRGPTTVTTLGGSGGNLPFPPQTQAGIYKVEADNGVCPADYLTSSVVIESTPVVQTVTGSDGCEGNSVTIGLADSENGVTYALLQDGSSIETVVSSGGQFDFSDVNSLGHYTVSAASASGTCTATMSGSYDIVASPASGLAVTLSGTGCSGSSHSITIGNAEANVDYSLYRDGTLVNTLTGAGTDLTFSGQTQARNYTVEADNGICPVVTLVNDVVINATPIVQTLTGTDGCEGENVIVGLADSQSGVSYSLLLDGNPVQTATSVGGPFSSFSAVNSKGKYTVIANNSGCPATMNGSVNVIAAPDDSFILSILSASPVCSGTSHVIQLSGSEVGVDYHLYRNSVSGSPLATVAGDGNAITFPGQTDAGTYIVTVDNGLCTPIELSSTVVINQMPGVFNVTGGGGCEGGNISIGLDGSQSGVNYVLYREDLSGLVTSVGSATGPSGAFAGNPVTFGTYSTAGEYTVVASSGGCTADMNGSVEISPRPSDVPFEDSTPICNTGEIAIDPSETGVQYILYKDGISTGNVIPGNGGRITFGDQPPGIYWVYARNIVNPTCEIKLSDSREVQNTPIRPTLLTSSTEYCVDGGSSGITLTTPSTEVNVNYQLYQDGSAYGNVRSGNGGSIQWTNVPAGTYYVEAVTTGGCTNAMAGTLTITGHPLPTANIHVFSAADRRCAGEPNPGFQLEVTLTGNPPFSFQIFDNNNNVIQTVSGHLSSTYRSGVDPTAFETTYRVENLTDDSSCSPVSGTGTAVFYVDPVPSITFDPVNPEVCLGNSITITASGAGTGGKYQWSDGLGNSASITVGPSSDQTYTVTAISQYGCSSADDITVVVNNLPVVDFAPPGDEYEVCINDGNIPLDPDPDGGSFAGTGITPFTNIFNTTNAGVGAHDITYTFQDGKGCVNHITKEMVVNPLPTVSITGVGTDYCADDPTFTINGVPQSSNGYFMVLGNSAGQNDWWGDNGDGTGWFSPSGVTTTGPGPGSYAIRYIYQDDNGCINTAEWTVTIHMDVSDNLDFVGLPSYLCETDPSVTLQARYGNPLINVTTNDGVFTGAGITDHGNGTATFDPSVANSGNHTITYTYTDPATGCMGSYSRSIQIGTTLTFALGGSYCYGDAAVTLDGDPDGGTFNIYNSGSTTTPISSGPDASVSFDPSVLPPDDYQVEYVYVVGGCRNTLVKDVEVVKNPDATFEVGIMDGSTFKERGNFCVTETNAVLKPNGSIVGNFTGDGVNGTTLNPSAAGAGTHTITYTVINSAGCTSVEQVNVNVLNLPDIDIDNLNSTYCDNEGPSTIEGNTYGVTGGTFNFSATTNTSGVSPLTSIDNTNGSATFDPSKVGPGVYWITMEYTHPLSKCENSVTKEVTVNAATPVNFGGLADVMSYCRDAADVTLTASFNNGTPISGGDFEISTPTGVGLTDNGDGTAVLHPSQLVVGNYQVTYTYTNPNGCLTDRIKTIEILPYPTAFDVQGGGNYCIGESGKEIILSGSETGVKYELLLNNISLSPQVELPGSGSLLNFGKQTIEGSYSVKATNTTSSCPALMNGTVDVIINDVQLSFSNKKNVACYLGSDGEVTVTASGGSSTYVYLWEKEVSPGTWSPVSSSATASGLDVGTYRVTVTDAIGCVKKSSSIAITQPVDFNISIDPSSVIPVDCHGAATGSFTVTASPASGSYEFSVDAGTTWQSSPTFTGLEDGTYWVSVKNTATGCMKIDEIDVEITEPANSLTITTTDVSPVTCHGGSDGELEITVSGGTVNSGSDYVYQWYRVDASGALIPVSNTYGGNTDHITNQPASDYRVLITDDKNCTYTSTPDIEIPQPSDWNVDYDVTNVSTYGSSDGSIVINSVSGQTSPYVVQLELPDGTIIPSSGSQLSYSGLDAGNYEIHIADDNTCSHTIPVTIIQPGDLVVDITPNDVTCTGGKNGSIEVSIVQGNPAYDITWNGTSVEGTSLSGSVLGQTNSFYEIEDSGNGLPAGTYTVNVVDDEGDSFSKTVTVAQPADISINKTIEKGISCSGAGDGELAFSISTSRPSSETDTYVVSWTGPNGFYKTGTLADATVTHLTNLQDPGTYDVTIYYGGTFGTSCQITESFTISEPNPLVINEDDNTSVTCHGDDDGSITVSVTGRPSGTIFTYSWEHYDTATSAWVPYAGNNPSISNLEAGQYRVTAQEFGSGCSVTSNIFEVDEPDELNLTYTKNNDVTSCSGDNTGKVILAVSGGTAGYTINYGTVSVSWAGSAPYVADSLYGGNYNFEVVDDHYCSDAVNVVISEPAPLDVNDLVYDIDCEATNSGTLVFDVSGGREVSGEYAYVVSLVHQTSGVDYGLNITGFVPTAGTPERNVSITNLPAGEYKLVVSDMNSTNSSACSYSESFKLEHIELSSSITKTTCSGLNNGAIDITVTGGSGNYNYTWTKSGDVTFAAKTSEDIAGLSAGTYEVEIKDIDRSCTITRTYVVENEHSMVISGQEKDVTCNGNSDGAIINVTVSDPSTSALTYEWTGGTLGSPVNTQDLANVGQGSYKLEVKDGSGCVAVRNFSVNEPDAVSFDLSTAIEDCSPYSRSVTLNNLSGGTGSISNFEYSWIGPGVPANNTTASLSGIKVGGTYKVTVKDENECEFSKSIVVPSQITVTADITGINCNGDNNASIVLHVQGGSGSYNYTWSQAAGGIGVIAADKDQTGLTAGEYTVIVTDNNESDGSGNCTVAKTFIITQPAKLTITGEKTDIICAGNANGVINLDVVGGTGNYTYAWSSANGSGLVDGQEDQKDLTGGTYSVTVTDDNSCTATQNFTINEPDPLAFDLDITPSDCDGKNLVQITNPDGGSGSYSYTWGGPGVTSGSVTTQADLPGGTYTVTMTDAGVGQQCQITKSFTLTKLLDVNYTVNPETCPGSNDGSISLTTSEGVPPYKYSWTTTDGSGLSPTEQNQNGLSSGTYEVTVTDDNTCDIVIPIEVLTDNSLTAAGSLQHVRCFGGSSGSIDLTVTGGSGNYLFNWTGPDGYNANTEDISLLKSGSYIVEIIDGGIESTGPSCRITKSFTITEPTAPVSISDVDITNVLCRGAATGEIDITVSGGTAPYKFNWTAPGNISTPMAEDISGLISGDYYVTVTDDNDCVQTFGPYSITQPVEALKVSLIEKKNVSVNNSNDGAIEIDVTGGSGSYSIHWYDGSGAEVVGSQDLTRVEGLTEGTYRVMVEDGNGCTEEITGIVISQPDSPLSLNITKRSIGPCHGLDNGIINVTMAGGVLPYQSITLYDGSGQLEQLTNTNSAVFDSLSSGDYQVIGIDANGIAVSEDVTVLERPELILNATVTQHVNCYESSTGIITVSASGGKSRASDGVYKIFLSGGPMGTSRIENPQSGQNVVFNNLPAGTYTIMLIDDSNPNYVDGSEDDPDVGYGDGNFDINNQSVKDCSKSVVLEIIQPEAELTISTVTGYEDVCAGESPSLQIITSGWDVSSNPLAVKLSDGETYTVNVSPFQFQPVDVPADGIHQYTIVSVEDASGCSKGFGTGIGTVIVHPLPTAHIFGNAEICYGESAYVGIELTGTPPFNVTISDGTNTWNKTYNSRFNKFTVTPLINTTYKILNVTDANCSNTTTSGQADITVNELPTVVISGNAQICKGESTDVHFEFNSGEAPWTVLIKENGNQRTVGPINSNTYDLPVSPLLTTDYVLVSVSDNNGCAQNVTGNIRVTVREKPGTPAVISGDDVVCQGSIHTYSINAVDNATGYVWSIPSTGATIVSGTGTKEIKVEFDTNAQSGNISVYGVNSCGNGPVRILQVNVDELPQTIGVIDGPADLCQGTTSAYYSVVAVADASSYNWEVPVGFSIVSGQGTASIEVELDPAVDITIGDIIVTPENTCGESLSSSNLEVEVHPLPEADAGSDQQLCGNTAILDAVDPASINSNWSGKWEVISGYAKVVSPASPSSSVTDISRGDVVLRWTVTNTASGGQSCSVSDEVTLRNNTLSVVADAEASLTCDGTSNIYGTAIPNYPNTDGRWTVVASQGSGVFDDATSASTTVYNLAPGANRLRWTITQNTCESYGEVVIVNDQTDEAKIDQQDLIDLCSSSTSLTANNPVQGTGKWSVEKGRATITPTNADGNETDVTNLALGENIIRWTISKNGNCSTYDEVVIRNNQLDVSVGDDFTTCESEVLIEGTNPPTGVIGQWTAIGAANGQVSFDDASSNETTVSGLINGENQLRWTLNKNGCESSDEIILTSNAPTQAVVESKQTVCSSETMLTGNTHASYESGRWIVIQGTGRFDDETNPHTRVTNIQKGTNVYRWTIYNGNCSTYDELTVVNQQVEAFAGKDTVSCEKYIYLNADPVPAGYSGHWSVEPGTSGAVFDGSIDDPKVGVQLLKGENSLRWNVTHNESGCSSSDVVNILINAVGSVNAGGDQIINNGSGQATMQGDLPSNATGEWSIISGGGKFDDETNPGTIIRNLSRGPNVLRWTVAIGNCSEYDEVTITNGDVIQAQTGPEVYTCSYEAVLEANDPENAIGEWSIGKIGSGNFEDFRDPDSKVYGLSPGRNEFVWTISYGIGSSSSSDTIVVFNNTPDDARAGLDDPVCDDTYVLKGNEPATDMGFGTWKILAGGGSIVSPDQAVTEVNGLSQGANTFIYTIQKGEGSHACYSTDSVTIVNALASIAYAGENDTICTDSVRLDPSIPIYGNGEWRVLEGEADFEGHWAKNLTPGRNVLQWVVSTGKCSSSDEVIIVNSKPSEPFAGQDRPVCGTTATLSGSEPVYGNGHWTLISGSGDIANPDNPVTDVTGLGIGSNRFRWTITNGQCSLSDEVEISNDLLRSFAGHEQTNCADTAVLEANNPSPGVGTWGVVGGSGSAKFDDSEDPNTIVRELDQGENILTWTVSYGQCTSVSYVSVTNNVPTEADAGGNKATCDNYINLAANSPEVGEGSWSIRNGGGDFISTSGVYSDGLKDPNARVENLKFGSNIYRWTIEHEGCKSSADVKIDFNTIQASVGEDRPICSDNEILNGNSAKPGIGTWTVVGGTSRALFENANDPNTTVRNLSKGRNTLRWTINYKGCETYMEVSITNNSPSTAYAGNTQTLCGKETVLDATRPDIGLGRWEVISGSATITTDNINNPKAPVSGLAQGENVLRWTVNNDICSSEDEVIVINNNPSQPYAGADYEEVCDPTLTLKAATPDYGEGIWSILQGGGNISDVLDPNATIKNITRGKIVLKWTVTKGQCSLSDTIIIENNTATVANAGPNIKDCKDWAILDANIPDTGEGEWSLVSGVASFDDTKDAITTVRDLGFGENLLMWEIQNGSCFSRDTVSIFNKVPDQAYAGKDQTFCNNYTTLNANNPVDGEGTWTIVSGKGSFDNKNAYNSIVREIGFGDNVYKWTIAYEDCKTESTVTIRSNKTDAYAGEDVVVYDPEVILNANNVGDLSATWSIVGGDGEFKDPTFFNTQVTGLQEGINTYRWTINVDDCGSSDDVSITYRPVPDAGFITDQDEGCWPLQVTFTNYSVNVQDRDYYWDFGDGNSSGDQNPVHIFEDAGDYPVVLTVPGPDDTEGRFQKIIRVYEHPEAAFSVTPQIVYVPGDEVRFFDLSVGAQAYKWHFGDGETSEEAHPVHEYQGSGIYDVKLHVTNEFGCVDSVTIEGAVQAIENGFVKFPNAFKPRPDGSASDQSSETNSIFKPVSRDVDTYHLQIYNRWGQLIYESYNIDEGWNGLYKGQLAPQAVYVWKVKGTFASGHEFHDAGSVLLLR
jgi:hypothetical protein